METRTLIKDTAQIARVNSLAEGDAYRRLISKDSYQEPTIALGVVTGVLNNGETVAITALEIGKSRFSADSEVKEKVFEADNDLVLFPANAQETEQILAEARRASERDIEEREKGLRNAREKAEKLAKVTELIDGAVKAVDTHGAAADHFDYLEG